MTNIPVSIIPKEETQKMITKKGIYLNMRQYKQHVSLRVEKKKKEGVSIPNTFPWSVYKQNHPNLSL